MERRDFLVKSLSAGALLGLNPFASCKPRQSLKLLVLGGTYFVGPAIVNAALQNNHSVTLFNRGVTNPDLFPDLPWIKGDREQGLEAYEPLKNKDWDVVIDVWPEKSKLVDEATTALQKHAKHYIFISSIAVYKDFNTPGIDEEHPTVSLDLPPGSWAYPEEKCSAESFVKERFQNNHTILRGGPIKGWRDPAMDIWYWCMKLKRQDAILAPGSGMDHLQFIDVGDVGRFALMAAENKLVGVYNCTGPSEAPLLWKDFLEKTRTHLNSEAKLVWASEDFLESNNVAAFSDLPLWTPLSEDAFMQISNDKLLGTGFTFTPWASTLDDCIRWHEQNSDPAKEFGTPAAGIGLSREQEHQLIRKLRTS